MQVVRTLDVRSWRHFLADHPDSNIFHTPEMFEVFVQAKGYRPSLWAVIDSARRPLALFLPVEVTLMGGPLRSVTTRAVVYGSILCAPGEQGEEALDTLLRAYRQGVGRKVMFTELRNVTDVARLRPILAQHGFRHQEYLNYLIDISYSVEGIFQAIGQRTRKNIRHALNRGQVVTEEIRGREEIRLCYELLRKTYEAASVPLADYSLFEAAYDCLAPMKMVRFSLARVGEAPAAVSVELLYKDVAYGWYGGTDRDYSSYMPNELLTWHILKWSAENGYHLYDFGGAGKPEEEYGVRDFKAKFGGQLVSYGRDVCVHAPMLMPIVYKLYQLSRRALYGQLEPPRLRVPPLRRPLQPVCNLTEEHRRMKGRAGEPQSMV